MNMEKIEGNMQFVVKLYSKTTINESLIHASQTN